MESGHDNKPHILIVEDDAEISALTARYLNSNEMTTSLAPDGPGMRLRLAEATPDLVVLDINLPGEDGLSLCLELRNAGGPPIIMVTAKGEDVDRILGLEMGADDYLPKPFNPRELLARIRAVLRRRSAERRISEGSLAFAGWTLNKETRQLFNPHKVRIALTSAEYDLLCVFSEHPGRVLSRERLLELTQGPGASSQERSIDILISRLRLKIETDTRDPQIIQTVRSLGYMFVSDPVQR